jgi:hypothetical protein
LELVEVDVCADEVSGLPLPAPVEADVVVAVCEFAVPEPGPSLVELVDEVVEVEACAAGSVEPDWAAVEPPAEVEEVVPVVACADEPPEGDWLPVDVVVPDCALELPEPAWLPVDVVVPVCALELPVPAWLPAVVVVPVCALELPDPVWLPAVVVVPVCALEFPDPAWLPAVVVAPACALELADPAWAPVEGVVPVCAPELPVAGWLEEVVVDGVVVVDVLFVWSVDVPPLDLFVAEDDRSGLDVHLVEYVLVVSPDVFDPEAETFVVVVELGAVVADVLDVVSVLDAPPFTVGVTLNWGWTLIIGWTVITGAEMALEIPLILIARPWDDRPWLPASACRPEVWGVVCVCWAEAVWTCSWTCPVAWWMTWKCAAESSSQPSMFSTPAWNLTRRRVVSRLIRLTTSVVDIGPSWARTLFANHEIERF